jgi:hypothetical protein
MIDTARVIRCRSKLIEVAKARGRISYADRANRSGELISRTV